MITSRCCFDSSVEPPSWFGADPCSRSLHAVSGPQRPTLDCSHRLVGQGAQPSVQAHRRHAAFHDRSASPEWADPDRVSRSGADRPVREHLEIGRQERRRHASSASTQAAPTTQTSTCEAAELIESSGSTTTTAG